MGLDLNPVIVILNRGFTMFLDDETWASSSLVSLIEGISSIGFLFLGGSVGFNDKVSSCLDPVVTIWHATRRDSKKLFTYSFGPRISSSEL